MFTDILCFSIRSMGVSPIAEFMSKQKFHFNMGDVTAF